MNIRDLFYSRNIQLAFACGIILYATVSACETSQEPETPKPQTTQKYSAYSDSINTVRLNKIIAEKDNTVNRLFQEIDSISTNKEKHTTDSLNNNENYTTRNNINRQLDSLRRDNKTQLRRAQRAAAESPSNITNIPCSEETFYTFFHVDGVKRARYTYDKNNRLIERLQDRRRTIPLNTTTKRNITQYFDSLTNAQITSRLKMIERLLQTKDSIINQKLK